MTTTLELPSARVPEATADSLFFIGNATLIVRINGITILTDPNFLHAGDHAHIGYGMTSRRLRDPAISIDALPPVDLVLLSHYHGDHFDQIVAERLDRTVPILTTKHAARALTKLGFRRVQALRTWDAVDVRKGARSLRITALPGKHGPGPVAAFLPPVMGSLIAFQRADGRGFTIYISGDTLVHDALREIPRRFPGIDLALLHLGGTRVLGVLVTLDGKGGVEALRIVDPRRAIPIHYEEYTVMKSPLADFRREVEAAGWADRVTYLGKGETYTF